MYSNVSFFRYCEAPSNRNDTPQHTRGWIVVSRKCVLKRKQTGSKWIEYNKGKPSFLEKKGSASCWATLTFLMEKILASLLIIMKCRSYFFLITTKVSKSIRTDQTDQLYDAKGMGAKCSKVWWRYVQIGTVPYPPPLYKFILRQSNFLNAIFGVHKVKIKVQTTFCGYNKITFLEPGISKHHKTRLLRHFWAFVI